MLSFSLSFASNLHFSLTFSKSYGKRKNILKAIAGWFATWDHNVVNFSPESYFKGWNISKQAKCNKSQEENAGKEKVKVLQVRGFWTARGRTAPMKQFQQNSLCALQELIRNSTVYKDSGKSVSCGEKKEQHTWKEHERTKTETASWKIIKPSFAVN